ncbi:MAG: cytochrome-c oxidase, cbb3-type subunit III [Parvularculaceae bacterium]|nr:cytochrome-c oxidase, cbb3-type subunit III [Parvularculaceae bacterium]
MAHKEIDAPTGVETTGHSWDGIKELNNPLPRWWVIVFWISVIWSIAYWVFMPSWPGLTGYLKGTRNHSERANVEKAVADLQAARSDQMKRLLSVSSVSEIENDPDLQLFAITAGKSIFGDNCATCHGAGGQGNVGFPNLADDDWLWGGALGDIQTTIHYGIRSDHPQTRLNQMLAYGESGALSGEQISDVVEHVMTISGREANAAAAARGAAVFEVQCASCHGADGKGNKALGAPNLTDGIWLYGGERTDIQQTIYSGRGGVMPAWTGRLSEEQMTALAVYVHSLGGGE